MWLHRAAAHLCADGHLSEISSALYHLLLLQTTFGVFAQELQPYYAVSQWSALFYVLFSVVLNLLVSKMVIAIGYDSYRQYMRAKIVKHVAMRNQALSIAYKLLDSGAGVTLDTWMLLCKQLARPDERVRNQRFCVCIVRLLCIQRGIPADGARVVPHCSSRRQRHADAAPVR